MNPKSVPMPKACNLFFIVSLVLFLILSAAGCRKDIHEVSAVQSGGAVNNADAAATPNIILILGDDVGYEVPACYGGQSYSTPFIDSIASAGRRFTNCYSAPSCSPSRFMLLSGKYNFRNYRKWGQMPITTKTIGNMFSDAGYSTCYAGKWQLDGGDNSIRTFGWQKYAVWLPFKLQDEGLEGSRYKSSKIYQDGGYMPQSYSYNKYSEDLFTDYILHFTDSMKNQSKPFFVYYSMVLCHGGFCPTPDDSEYTTWDYTKAKGDVRFYPSMVKYMDKKIKQLVNHLDSAGQLNNTLILYLGDNGCPPDIVSLYNGRIITGGKGATTEIGSSVPLIAYWKNHITPGIQSTIIDFTDMLPTLAEVAKIPAPTTWGVLDGQSFYSTFTSAGDVSIRSSIYDSYTSALNAQHPFIRWTQNSNYKLYDTVTGVPTSGFFVKVNKCMPDSVLDITKLTLDETSLRSQMLITLRNYRTDTRTFIPGSKKQNN